MPRQQGPGLSPRDVNGRKKDKERFREVRNAKAHREYFIDETFEAGLVLTGTEVKSIRMGQAQISEAFVRMDHGKPVLYHAHIAEYAFGNYANHNPYRPRRLLLHKKEIRELEHEVKAGGRTIIPLRLYFKQALVKIEIALAHGKKVYDKREDLKKEIELREAERAIRTYN